jgi:hypothetical protein
MGCRRRHIVLALCSLCSSLVPAAALAQDAPHDHTQMSMPAAPGWELMQDGIVFAEFNHQGGPRGGSEFVVPNWWMGMASRPFSRGRLTLTGMLSLDPATVGRSGYREIFQAGEALDGQPLIDRQHPHDLFMQLGAIWRMPMTNATGFTVAGGPVAEPALGPVAFMHRASAADNPTAPLGHHTFDSTHIAFGVVTAAVDHGAWVVEGSLFNGREPDDNRWDLEFGPLDSFSGRLWYRPSGEWELQASSGRLKDPEQLEPGNIVRSTVSGSWTRKNGVAMSSFTAAFGRNDTDHGDRSAMFVEGSRRAGGNTLYGRFEAVQVEASLLQADPAVEGDAAGLKTPVLALTLGGVRELGVWRGFEGGIGADVTFYGVPNALQSAYSSHPVSFHVFFRVRPPAGSMGRMWNMRMSQPPAGHGMAMPMNHPMP